MICSLIISVYNDARFLAMIFEALKRQTEKDFEVVIADDGSGKDFVETLNRMTKNAPFPVTHVWHEDKGWRKDIILNKAVEASHSEYLIFLDGDCIPHHKFIEEHLRFACPGKVVGGRRVQLNKRLSDELTPEKIASGYLGWKIVPELLWSGIKGKERHTEECIRITGGFIRHLILKERWKNLLGCNFSIFKEDLLAVNGFDERFTLPGLGEDSDLENRLNRKGIYCKVERHIMTVYHRSHKRTEPDSTANIQVFNENNANNVSWTPYGIKKSGEPAAAE